MSLLCHARTSSLSLSLFKIFKYLKLGLDMVSNVCLSEYAFDICLKTDMAAKIGVSEELSSFGWLFHGNV